MVRDFCKERLFITLTLSALAAACSFGCVNKDKFREDPAKAFNQNDLVLSEDLIDVDLLNLAHANLLDASEPILTLEIQSPVSKRNTIQLYTDATIRSWAQEVTLSFEPDTPPPTPLSQDEFDRIAENVARLRQLILTYSTDEQTAAGLIRHSTSPQAFEVNDQDANHQQAQFVPGTKRFAFSKPIYIWGYPDKSALLLTLHPTDKETQLVVSIPRNRTGGHDIELTVNTSDSIPQEQAWDHYLTLDGSRGTPTEFLKLVTTCVRTVLYQVDHPLSDLINDLGTNSHRNHP